MKRLYLLVLLSLCPALAATTPTPRTHAGREAVFRRLTMDLAKQLRIVELSCAGKEIPQNGEFKFCGVYKGDYFKFISSWKKAAEKQFSDANRLWIQSSPGSYFGEASAKANHYWTFFASYTQQTASTGFVTFGMYEGLEEH